MKGSSPQMLHAPIALVNARLVDPVSGQEGRGGVLVSGGLIQDLGAGVTRDAVASDIRIVDCGGDVVSPGLIDMRVFVGEPGAEHRETIASASRAAAAGGVTTICVTPDTSPAIDDPAIVDFLMRRARDNAQVRVLPVAALTKGLKGREISEIGLLGEAGAVAFSNGRHSVRNAQVMRRAMTYARDFDALIMHVAQDEDLAGSGVMNAGELASRLGLTGIPREAEAIVLDRDMRLVAMTGGRYHAELISTSLSLDIMARAKQQGMRVSCGVSINNLTLNENDIGDYRTFLKLMPPLRHEDERLALVEGLASGVIDVIVSDHDGQDVEAKRVPFAEAEAGAVGLETLLAAGLRLVHADQVSLPILLRAMTSRPAEILGLPQGRLAIGAPADLIRFDPDEPFVVDPATLHTVCKNTPFDEARLQGRVKMTLVAGAPVHE
ncbi:MAG: dihydroorotase [Hyphomicrobiales bacterium]|nr:dihydroorotase [Hyphomicrobiales bacterium]